MKQNTDADNDSDAQHPNCYQSRTDPAASVSASFDAVDPDDCHHPQPERVGRVRNGTAQVDLDCTDCGETVARDIRGRTVDRGRGLATDGGEYTAATRDIGIVDGLAIDITIRDIGAGERDADKVLLDLKQHLGELGYAFETETPPDELGEIPDEFVPLMVPDWDARFGEEADTTEAQADD